MFKDLYLDKADTEFAVAASPEVFQKYEVKENSVVLFKKVGRYYDANSRAFSRKAVNRYKQQC